MGDGLVDRTPWRLARKAPRPCVKIVAGVEPALRADRGPGGFVNLLLAAHHVNVKTKKKNHQLMVGR